MPDTLHISTYSLQPVVDQSVADAMNRTLGEAFVTEVQAHTSDFEPPAAGMSEIAFTIVGTGLFALVVEFFRPLATAAGEAYRDDVLRLIRGSRRSKESGRQYVPLHIVLGEASDNAQSGTPVRYFFHGDIDDVELLKRLIAADKHIRTIPRELFSGIGGPPECSFYWDEQEERWRGQVFRYPEEPWGEYWFPPNIHGSEE